MNQDQPLRRLLDELQAADAERQGEPRDTPAYAEALNRVDRLMKAVWKEAGDVPATRPPPATPWPRTVQRICNARLGRRPVISRSRTHASPDGSSVP